MSDKEIPKELMERAKEFMCETRHLTPWEMMADFAHEECERVREEERKNILDDLEPYIKSGNSVNVSDLRPLVAAFDRLKADLLKGKKK